MNQNNVNQYLMSLETIKAMHKNGILSDADYSKAEEYLAKKYCIKKGSIYRANDLINKRFRVMYVLPKKEVQNGTKNDNQNRCVTTIEEKA